MWDALRTEYAVKIRKLSVGLVAGYIHLSDSLRDAGATAGPAPAEMRKALQNPRTSQGNKPIRYQGACPFCGISLNPIYSYSYRADSGVAGCAF